MQIIGDIKKRLRMLTDVGQSPDILAFSEDFSAGSTKEYLTKANRVLGRLGKFCDKQVSRRSLAFLFMNSNHNGFVTLQRCVLRFCFRFRLGFSSSVDWKLTVAIEL